MTTTPAARARVKRLPERANYDRAAVHEVLDQGLIAHVSFSVDGQPFVIPMAYARDGEDVLLHGSVVSRLMQAAATGIPLCVGVTLVDALVLARSVFHHSMNYRSVVVFGRGVAVTDPTEKLRGLERLVEHLIPGRSAEARAPNRKELAATTLIRMTIEDATLKSRSGPPSDAAADRDQPIWGGLLPLSMATGEPVPDTHNRVPLAASVARWRRDRSGQLKVKS